MLVQNLLEHSVANTPDKLALICGKNRLTYEQINRFADQMADTLLSFGIRPQDRIVIYMDNSVEAVISIFAILKAGGVFIILPPDSKPRKLGYILKDSGARLIVSQMRKQKTIEETFAKTPGQISAKSCHLNLVDNSIEITFHNRPLDVPADRNATAKPKVLAAPVTTIEHQNPDSLAALIYTSGSSGRPKGVMAAHGNMIAAIESITGYLENTQNDIILNVLPLSFDYGLYQLLMTFSMGCTLVLEKSFTYPYSTIRLIAEEKVTGFPVVPTMVAILLRLEKLDTYDFSSLRYVTSTGAHLPTAFINALKSFLPHVKIYCMYGLTECKRVSYLPPDRLAEKAGSVGIPMPNVSVSIVDEYGREVRQGEVGELLIRGPNVTLGYWNAPEETAQKFRRPTPEGDICLYSGDLFKKDEDGFLYFVARKDDLIKVKGERVSPKEIESVLCDLDEISEAAVIGIPDPLHGQIIKAVIVKKDGCLLTDQNVLKYCATHLETHMIPKYIEFVNALPKINSCKIDKTRLHENKKLEQSDQDCSLQRKKI